MADAAATHAAILVVDRLDQRPDVGALLERRFGADYDILRRNTGEAAAYNAEIAYIRENGQDPWRVMDLSYPFYYFLTTCREENDYDL